MSLNHIVMNEASPLEAKVAPFTASLAINQGDVLVHIAKFVLTSNTVTYALLGRVSLKTFVHYPTGDANFASSPAWGVGIVVASRSPHVQVGQRIHGYFPMRKYCVLTPSKIKRGAFEDTAPHRSKLINAYRNYRLSEPLDVSKVDHEDMMTADGLLFGTGWSATMQAVSKGATSIVFTSASSRTSLTGAFAAKFHNFNMKRIGITSSRNVQFVKDTGIYDVVVTYDTISSLSNNGKFAIYDMAGNSKVNSDLRKTLGSSIIDFGSVGKTNVGFGGKLFSTDNPDVLKKELKQYGGAPPAPFLIFVAMANAQKEHGPAKVGKMLSEAQAAYANWKLPTFNAERAYGAEATLKIWDKTVKNECEPGVTYVCSLWPDMESSELILSSAKM